MGAAEQIEQNKLSASSYLINDNCVTGLTPDVLTSIYQEHVNLAVFQRYLSDDVKAYCQQLIEARPSFNLRTAATPETLIDSLGSSLPPLDGRSAFVDDLALLIDMYACLFDLEEVGLRLQAVDRAMCPRFHVDKLGCRLVTTYRGNGTEWLRNRDVNRTKLGKGNMGLKDSESGLYSGSECIQQVNEGDIVFLKGEGWYKNEGAGIVHRSPPVMGNEKRIVATIDYA